MKRTPISLIIDDPAPVLSVYHEHTKNPITKTGKPCVEYYPNSLLNEFCDVIETYGFKGKFSVVPMPGNRGDIVRGIRGVERADMEEWLNTVKTRVVPRFSIGPEMLTHHKAVDLSTGAALPINEQEWASTQDRTTLLLYISCALSILRESGFSPIGVTSPWQFGIEVEDAYTDAISRAVYEACGSREAWFFLRGLRDVPNAKPWVEREEEGRILVAVPATLRDIIWKTIDSDRTDDAYISQVADEWITADGREGEILRVLETGGYPILITHWQSLMSNGLGTGIRILAEVGVRIQRHLGERVEWMSAEELMHMVISDKANYPKPTFA